MDEQGIAVVDKRRSQQPDYESREIIETIKNTVAKGATDAELKMFIAIAKSTGLNPFLKEIWCAVPMKDGQRSQYGQVLIMAARDGYLRIANEHPMFDGIETRVERDDKTQKPIKAVCTVWRKDRNHPTISEAYYNEYYKPGFGGKPSIWDTYASAMIGKVAEVLALKRSFSINGVVTEEEVGMQQQGPPQQQESYPEIDTGGIPQGTKEAAAFVAQRKIAEAKAKAPEVPPVPVQVLWNEMTDKFTGLQVLGRLKSDMIALVGQEAGEQAYYEILGSQGVGKSNEFQSLNPMKIAVKKCWEFLDANKVVA